MGKPGHVRLRAKIVEILNEMGPLNTTQILDKCNERMLHGTTMQELTNVLRNRCREEQFVKVRKDSKRNMLGGYYDIQVWGLK